MGKSRLIKGLWFTIPVIIFSASLCLGEDLPPVSDDTETCIECHASLHPGIVKEWRKSAHAKGRARPLDAVVAGHPPTARQHRQRCQHDRQPA